MTNSPENQRDLSLSIDIGLKWFEVHANQRMSSIRFFLFAVGFCVVGFISLWSAGQWLFGLAIGLFLSTITECFRRLDKRTSQLVKVAERLIQECTSELEASTGLEHLDVVHASDRKENTSSYSDIFDLIFTSSHVLASLIFLFSLVKLVE